MQTELNNIDLKLIINLNSCLCSSVAELKSFNLKVVSSSLLVGMFMIFQFFDCIFGPTFLNTGSNPDQNWNIYHTLPHPWDMYQGLFRGIQKAPRGLGSGGKWRKLVKN